LKALHRSPNFSANGSIIRVVSNKVTSKEEGLAVYNKLNSVVMQFLKSNVEYFGMIPQDTMLEKAVRQQKIISMQDTNAKSTKAFEQLANKLLNGAESQEPVKWGIAQIFSNLLKRSQG
jgi:flagellar biosynthesis protein FlhG